MEKRVRKGRFCPLFSDLSRIFFVLFSSVYQFLERFLKFFLKKYFGSLENGCIFASAFDGKRLVEKVVEKRGKSNLKRMRR